MFPVSIALVAVLFFLLSYFNKKILSILIMAVAFIFFGLEEISYGQHFFDYAMIGDWWLVINNSQKELNIHNYAFSFFSQTISIDILLYIFLFNFLLYGVSKNSSYVQKKYGWLSLVLIVCWFITVEYEPLNWAFKVHWVDSSEVVEGLLILVLFYGFGNSPLVKVEPSFGRRVWE